LCAGAAGERGWRASNRPIRARPAPPTSKGELIMATILNVLGKLRENDKYLTIDPATFGAAPKRDPEPENWRQELDELERRGVGSLPSVEQAERAAKELEDQVESEHRSLVNQAKKARQLASSEAFSLSALERTHLAEQAAKLEERARDLKSNTRVSIAQAKALVETCKQFGPLKPRLLELRKRAKELGAALAKV
jgi:PHD/YefM family antitoxin component YafN of YafNO toxin-antitoxin module